MPWVDKACPAAAMAATHVLHMACSAAIKPPAMTACWQRDRHKFLQAIRQSALTTQVGVTSPSTSCSGSIR